MNGKALLLIFLVVFAVAATSVVLLSSNTPVSGGVNFAESHGVVQIFDEAGPEGIPMDGPGMPG